MAPGRPQDSGRRDIARTTIRRTNGGYGVNETRSERTSLALISQILRLEFPRFAELGILPLGCALMDDLGLDSVEMVGLQVAIEDQFSLRFDPLVDDLAEIFRTVDSLASYLDQHRIGGGQ